MNDMQNQAQESKGEQNTQIIKNAALGVTGATFLIPLFFIDTGNAHSVEAKAASERYRHLENLYEDRGCSSAISTLGTQKLGTSPVKSQPSAIKDR